MNELRETPVEESIISLALTQQHKAINEIESAVEKLHSKLMPILKEDTKKEDILNEQDAASYVPLATEIINKTNRIKCVVNHLEGLISLCEC